MIHASSKYDTFRKNLHDFTTTKGTMVKISSLLELRLVTSLSLNFLKMMVMLLARAVLQNRRIEANTKSFLEKKIDYFDDCVHFCHFSARRTLLVSILRPTCVPRFNCGKDSNKHEENCSNRSN